MDAVAQPVMLGTKEFFVTCSIGVAVYPSEGTAAETLIEHADIAMYRAKKLGRNNFQFYHAGDERGVAGTGAHRKRAAQCRSSATSSCCITSPSST